jgi:ferredoxin
MVSPKLVIDLGECVRVSTKESNCQKCSDICPKSSITFDENIPLLDQSCIDCGGCIGVCPSQAISLPNFNEVDFVFDLFEKDEKLISCKKNSPCLSAFSVETLISIAILAKGKIELDLTHCDSCEIKDPLYDQIKSNIKEANLFLDSIGVDYKISTSAIGYQDDKTNPKETLSKREFLKKLSLEGVIESKVRFEKELENEQTKNQVNQKDTTKQKNKKPPKKRQLLFMALNRIKDKIAFTTFDKDELSFISNKSIDKSCDNCSLCYRLCPTSALSTDQNFSKIFFDPLLCIKCHICHDVCQRDSICLEDFNSSEFVNEKLKTLITFQTLRCEECGMIFTPTKGERLCRRCFIEEEEAKSLWGIE